MLFEWDTLEHARAFSESEGRKETTREAGDVGQPAVVFLEPVEAFHI